jgi:hypothetical protein
MTMEKMLRRSIIVETRMDISEKVTFDGNLP